MINTKHFFNELQERGINFSTGVPDSLLKHFCAYISANGNDIIAANEGGAIGLAAGYFLATGNIPLVYMQNSGIGNAINPLTSLVDSDVYSIPLLLMIGWRGEPGIKDEPQHIKQGRITEELLDTLEIPYVILSKSINKAKEQLTEAFNYMEKRQAPYALLVKKNTFEDYSYKTVDANRFTLSREEAIKHILDYLDVNDIIISTTGKTSREVFEYRAEKEQPHDRDFLTVGSMGHASKIALGIALEKPNKRIFCLDGDGAAIMHLGTLAIIGTQEAKNYKHILLNNGSHDSVGGQPSVGLKINFPQIALACNYKAAYVAETLSEIDKILPEFIKMEGPVLLEIKVKKGARNSLGRPNKTPIENKIAVMKKLSSN